MREILFRGKRKDTASLANAFMRLSEIPSVILNWD